MKVKWFGDQTTSRLQAKLFGNVDEAGALYQEALETKISIPGPPRSSPGSPPHIDTGDLILSWARETDGVDAIIVSRVSTDTPYAVDLEYGTDNMAARPFAEPTLLENADRLGRTVCKQ